MSVEPAAPIAPKHGIKKRLWSTFTDAANDINANSKMVFRHIFLSCSVSLRRIQKHPYQNSVHSCWGMRWNHRFRLRNLHLLPRLGSQRRNEMRIAVYVRVSTRAARSGRRPSNNNSSGCELFRDAAVGIRVGNFSQEKTCIKPGVNRSLTFGNLFCILLTKWM
jgi:hypothetical protein